LERIVAEKWLTARGVVGLWPCHRNGDDVFVQHRHSDDHRTPDGGSVPEHIRVPDLDRTNEQSRRLCFLRQQVAKRAGRANMCLADFVDPAGDWIGGFAVAIHGIEPHLERFRADTDDYSDILLKALADRFAEAFAERLHQHVRTALWGYAQGEQLTNEALIREEYRGIRPAPGYPACPEHSLKTILFEMLDVERTTGATLTESFAMLPTAAVSGFYFAHPQAEYFGVARIGEDQVADYAVRRGVEVEQARRWLRPNLD
jgi:5-methyltetrahydrofolate--homocysteine methyltransferase